MNLRIILFVVLSTILLYCKNDSTEPVIVLPETFSFRMTVQGANGLPVPGLRISAHNDLTIEESIQSGALSPGKQPHAVSTIGFSSLTQASVYLAVFDMNNRPVSVLIQNETIQPGVYTVDFSVQLRVPTRVYKCLMISRDLTTGGTLFRDSIYAVLSQPDAEWCVLGVASSAGSFETSDTLLFPNLLRLPPLVRTLSSGPAPVGTFAILDSVTFTLTDTVALRSQTFRRAIKRGVNDIPVVWNPSSSPDAAPDAGFSRGEILSTRVRRLSNIASDWNLDQNFPNPFN